MSHWSFRNALEVFVIILLVQLAVVGFLLYLITTYVPMPQPMRTTIIAIAVVMVVIYLLGVFGVVDLPIPSLRR